jgi:hypothetical protein
MRRVLVVLFVALAMLVVAPSATPQQPEPEPFPCEVFTTGESYATEHVSAEAEDGNIGGEGHIPGSHLGYSQCVR